MVELHARELRRAHRLYLGLRQHKGCCRASCRAPERARLRKVVLTDLARSDMAEAVEDAFRYDRLVLATTTYNAELFPFMREFISELTERGYRGRKVGLVENGSWAPMAAKVMRGMLEGCKDITFTEYNRRIPLGSLRGVPRSDRRNGGRADAGLSGT